MRTLVRESAMPLWAQLAADLRRRLAAGEFTDRFPTDEELCESYGVSRHTARTAVRDLQAAGMVQRERGRGSKVANSILSEEPLRGQYLLTRSTRADEDIETSDILACRLDPAGDVAPYLDVSPREKVVFVERRRMFGDEPLALHRSWLPRKIGRPLLNRDLRHGSFYHLLADLSGVRVTGGWERVAPTVPTAAERRMLGMSPKQGAFEVERLALAGSVVVEFRCSVLRGDRYRMVAEWSPDDSPWRRPQ